MGWHDNPEAHGAVAWHSSPTWRGPEHVWLPAVHVFSPVHAFPAGHVLHLNAPQYVRGPPHPVVPGKHVVVVVVVVSAFSSTLVSELSLALTAPRRPAPTAISSALALALALVVAIATATATAASQAQAPPRAFNFTLGLAIVPGFVAPVSLLRFVQLLLD